jgi:smad nuclear-interacting protein 1
MYLYRSPKREEFLRPPQPPSRHHSRREEEEEDSRGRAPRGDDRTSSSGNNKDVKREKDWNNFFNPQSDMSRQAAVKVDHNAAEREQRMEEYGRPPSKDGGGNKEEEEAEVEKEKPNFGLSGKLTEETNTYRGVVIKYSEPPEARKPLKTRWRLYPFKEGESLEVMYIHRQSAYLLGRERKIADIPIDHPSCSKQHAVIQYRLVPYEKPNGSKGRRIRPYIIDLESANGTMVNGKRIEAKRYVELMEKDVLKFGFSSREYVVLHDQSKDDEPSDDEELNVDKSPSPE